MTEHEDAPPRPAVRKRNRFAPFVWLIPLAAAAGAGWYVRDHLERRGPLVVIDFSDASGIRAGDTPVLYRGVEIGTVVGVELSANGRRARIKARLRRRQASFARDGAAFWLVSPQVSESGVRGVNTLFSGPYIEAQPGEGKEVAEFIGLRDRPEEPGALHIVLQAPRFAGLRSGAPVTYRGIQVGVVQDIRLSREAESTEARLVIWRGYRPLVRTHTRFWTAGGVDVKGGLLSGVELKIESLRNLVSGGVAFATPDKDMGELAKEGGRFPLEDEAPKNWLRWAPRIPILPMSMGDDGRESRLPTGRDLMESKLK